MITNFSWYRIAGWQKILASVVTIAALVSFAALTPVAQAQVAPAANPSLGESCGLDIALVLDNSVSIDSGELTTMKSALNGFVTSLVPATPTDFSVTVFNTTASVAEALTGNATDVTNAITAITTSSGFTNWQDGLVKAQTTFGAADSQPNLVVFASDGTPNRSGDPAVGSGAGFSQAAFDAAVTQANSMKGAGTYIITLGIGSDVVPANLQALSSASDYYSAEDFDALDEALEELALDLCGGTVTVTKLIDADGDSQTTGDQSPAGSGWQFAVGAMNEATGAEGQALFSDVPQGTPDVVETVQSGYELIDAYCDTGTPNVEQNKVSGVTVGPFSIVSCTFINSLDHGTLKIVKHVVGGGPKDADDFTLSIPGASPNSVSGNEAGVEVTVPVGAYTVTELQANTDNYTTLYSDDCDGTMTPGGTPVCTVTNTYTPPVNECTPNDPIVLYSGSANTEYVEGGTDAVLVGGTGAAPEINERWTASIPGALWIWGEEPFLDRESNITEHFTRHFTITGTPTGGTLEIAADNGYSVTINGDSFGCADSEEFNYQLAGTIEDEVVHDGQDSCVIPAEILDSGDNVIEFTVNNIGIEDAEPPSNPAGLLYKLTVNSETCGETSCVNPNSDTTTPFVFGSSPEMTLQQMLDGGGYSLSATADNKDTVSWTGNGTDTANFVVKFINRFAGAVTTFGYHANGGPFTPLFTKASNNNDPIADVPFSVPALSSIVFAIETTFEEETNTFTTNPANNGGDDHATVYHPSANEYVLGFEDLPFADADKDYNDMTVSVKVTSCTPPVTPDEPTATLKAYKIVCPTEDLLPNLSGDDVVMTSTTASDFITANPTCHLEPWTFEWAPTGTPNPGDETGVAGGAWTAFAAGDTGVEVPAGALVWVREQFNDDYVPFSGVEGSSVSAEIYCNADVLHYDNYDFINPVEEDETYYCVAWNAPVPDGNEEEDEPECSNGFDDGDSEDTLADNLDPGCHTDGNAGNSESYDEEDDDESNTGGDGPHGDNVPACKDGSDNDHDGMTDWPFDPGCNTPHDDDESNSGGTNGGGGGGGGGGIYGGGGGGGGGFIQPPGQVLGAACGLYMNKHLKQGSAKNDTDQTLKLQTFLNKWMGANLPITGYFGPLTATAVNAFQAKYSNEILKPWGIGSPTTLVYLSTLYQINKLECPELTLNFPSLIDWSKNPSAQ